MEEAEGPKVPPDMAAIFAAIGAGTVQVVLKESESAIRHLLADLRRAGLSKESLETVAVLGVIAKDLSTVQAHCRQLIADVTRQDARIREQMRAAGISFDKLFVKRPRSFRLEDELASFRDPDGESES